MMLLPPLASSNAHNLIQFQGTLWWLDLDSAEMNDMLIIMVVSTFALSMSTVVIFGTFLAFYSFLGRSPADNMEFTAELYQHFTGVFADFNFSIPSMRMFDLGMIQDMLPALASLADFSNLEPYQLLESSSVFSAMNFVIGLIKPLVSAMTAVFKVLELVQEDSKPLGEAGYAEADNNEWAIQMVVSKTFEDRKFGVMRRFPKAKIERVDGTNPLHDENKSDSSSQYKFTVMNDDTFDLCLENVVQLFSGENLVELNLTGCNVQGTLYSNCRVSRHTALYNMIHVA